MGTDKTLRRAFTTGLIVLSLGFFAGGLSAATYDQNQPRLAFGLNGDYILNNAVDHGNCVGGGATFLVALSKNIAVEISGQFNRYSTLGDAANPLTTLSPGHLTQIPLQAMLQLRLPLNSLPLVPYIAAGGGVSLNSFTLDETTLAGYQALGYDLTEEAKASLILSVGAGLDFIASPRMMVGLHFQYRFGSADGTATITEQVSGATVTQALTDINLKSIAIGLGVKYVF
jgi:opacity protein-like surface antigen